MPCSDAVIISELPSPLTSANTGLELILISNCFVKYSVAIHLNYFHLYLYHINYHLLNQKIPSVLSSSIKPVEDLMLLPVIHEKLSVHQF